MGWRETTKAEERGKVSYLYHGNQSDIVSTSFEVGRGSVSMAMAVGGNVGNSGGVQSTASGQTVPFPMSLRIPFPLSGDRTSPLLGMR